MATIIRKDPDAKLDYVLSWSSVFDSADTLSTVVWTVPAGLTKESQAESTLSSTIVLSGGVAGTSYTLIATATSTAGYIEDQEITVYIEQALIIEDGSIVAGAESYVTVQEFEAYTAKRGISVAGNSNSLLLSAMDYLETLLFIGTKKTEAQTLQWPRDEVYIDGYYIESTTIPAELKTAQIVAALTIDAGNDLLSNAVERKTVREKVGPIEVQYSETSGSKKALEKINTMLNKLLSGGRGINAIGYRL